MDTLKNAGAPDLRIAVLSVVNPGSPRDYSMVPQPLTAALDQRPGVVASRLSTAPPSIPSLLPVALSVRLPATAWRRASRHARSTYLLRGRQVRRAARDLERPADVHLYVRGVWRPDTRRYAAFIDATTEMLVETEPAYEFSGRTLARLLALERAYYHGAVAVYTTSPMARLAVIDGYDVPAERVVCVGNGANLDRAAEVSDAVLTDRFHRCRLVLVGRAVERKGVPVAMAALTRLRHRLPHATLTLVGPSPDEVRAVPGARAVGELRDVHSREHELQKAAVLVAPSTAEPFGMAVAEGMGLGLPAVVSAVGGLPWLVNGGRAGGVVPVRDPDALADRCGELLTDLGEYLRAARVAHRRSASFTWERVAEGIALDLAERLSR